MRERDRERGLGVSSGLHYVVLVVAVSWKQCTEREREREGSSMLFPLIKFVGDMKELGIFRHIKGTREVALLIEQD